MNSLEYPVTLIVDLVSVFVHPLEKCLIFDFARILIAALRMNSLVYPVTLIVDLVSVFVHPLENCSFR